jgi:hypothetical protein
VTSYGDGVYRSSQGRPQTVFTLPFVLVIASLFAIASLVMFRLTTPEFPVVQAAVGGWLIGVGVGTLCRWIDRGRYS